jgi:hypothetical protein
MIGMFILLNFCKNMGKYKQSQALLQAMNDFFEQKA